MFPAFIFCRFRPLPRLKEWRKEALERFRRESSACKGVLWGKDAGLGVRCQHMLCGPGYSGPSELLRPVRCPGPRVSKPGRASEFPGDLWSESSRVGGGSEFLTSSWMFLICTQAWEPVQLSQSGMSPEEPGGAESGAGAVYCPTGATDTQHWSRGGLGMTSHSEQPSAHFLPKVEGSL